MREPKDIVDAIEKGNELPDGDNERFTGYGVMGVPFRSGHALALRRFPNASIGEGYTSIWHRHPDGKWIFIQDAPPKYSCSRYFGSAVDWSLQRNVDLTWNSPREFVVSIEGDYPVTWEVSLTQNAVSRAMNAAAGWIPDRWWRNPSILRAFGKAGGLLMGSSRLNLTGRVPNGQWFVANPKTVWMVESCKAEVCGRDLGPMGPLPEQVNLADVWLPQSGRFFIGNVYMETLNPEQHLTSFSRNPETKAENVCYV